MVLFKKDDITYKTSNFIFSYVNAVNLNAMGIILAGKHRETYSELHSTYGPDNFMPYQRFL